MPRRRHGMRARSPHLVLPLLIAAASAAVLPTARAQETVERVEVGVLREEEHKGAPTNELLVFLKPGTDPAAFARDYGMAPLYRLRSDPNAYVFATESVQTAHARAMTLRLDRRMRAVYNNEIAGNQPFSFTPDDPYFFRNSPAPGWPGQWHLLNQTRPGSDANVTGAWNRDLTGAGVTIGIVDDSLQTDHPDLAPNYRAAQSWDFVDSAPDPSPASATDNHGTPVAGIAAARGGNGIGVTGAAPYAGLAGLRVNLNSGTTAQFVDATLYHSSGDNTDIKVKNHSYGRSGSYYPTPAERDALAVSAAAGTIHVFAAGSAFISQDEESGTKMLQASPDAITVAALDINYHHPAWSASGANVFVAAPSDGGMGGLTTTDRTGEDGLNATGTSDSGHDSFPDLDYASRFSGTSAAAPVVAGVMALGKQANPTLDVRLAKHALVRSSSVNTFSRTSADGLNWQINGAGHHFNPQFGFGKIDADAFTRWVVALGGVSPLSVETVPLTVVSETIPDNSTAGITRTFDISATTPLEEVQIALDITHAARYNLEAYLMSPSGTRSRLFRRDYLLGADIDWTFTSNAFWGENPQGTWTLTVTDEISGATGTWNTFAARMRMGTPTNAAAELAGVAIVSPTPVKAGTTATGRVTLSGPAPAGGAVVRLYADNYHASVPAAVTVPEGDTAADFAITADTRFYDTFSVKILADYGVTRAVNLPLYRCSISGTVRNGNGGQGGVAILAHNPATDTVTTSTPSKTNFPGGGWLQYGFGISDFGTVQSLKVSVNITHPRIGDLTVSLSSPDGTKVLLHNRTGGETDNLIATYPATSPAGDLSVFAGKSIGGSWTLEVLNAGTSAGTLNSWSLTLTNQPVTRTATTAADGTYTIDNAPAGTYTVTPSSAGQTFTPASRTVTVGIDDAVGVDFGTTTTYAALDFGQASDGTTRLLMQNGSAIRIQKWNGTAMQVGRTYNPTAGWSPVGIAPDDGTGGTFLLWKKSTTLFQLWRMNVDGTLAAALPVQPAGGWSALDVSSGGDGTARVLLVSPLGQARVACINGATVTYGPIYKPAAGWSAAGIATGADNKTRLLWKNGTTSYQLWTLNAAGALSSAGAVRSTGGAAALGLSQSGDGSTRVLLESGSGPVSVNAHGGVAVQTGDAHTPPSGCAAVGISADPGAGGAARLLWRHPGGSLHLWTLDAAGALQSSVRITAY